jgi:propionyl-CoA carboxylase alpha chain
VGVADRARLLGDLLTDLRAESAALDAVVADLEDTAWLAPTPAEGWTIAVQITHLAWTDAQGVLRVEGRDDVVLVSVGPHEVVLEVAGVEHRLAVSVVAADVDVDGDGWAGALRLLPRFPDAAAAVAAGQRLLVLEAMKMQHPVVAGAAGVVQSLDVVPGAQVDAGTVLAVIEQEDA